MAIACRCEREYGDNHIPGCTVWDAPDGFTTLQTASPKRCRNCSCTVRFEAVAVMFIRYKIAASPVELRIHGEGGRIPRASHFLCEECGDLYFNLADRGYDFEYVALEETLKLHRQAERERLDKVRDES